MASFMPSSLARWPACSPARCSSSRSPRQSCREYSLNFVSNFSNQVINLSKHHETFPSISSQSPLLARLQKACLFGGGLECSGRKETHYRAHAKEQRQLLLRLFETGR